MKVSKNERGFGLIEVIIVAAIISIIALGIGTMISDMFAAQQKANHSGTLNTTRARLVGILNSNENWEVTVNHADNTASLGCLREGTAECADGATGPINVFEAGPTAVYASATATQGFRLDGTNCNTFSAVAPDPTCPVRWTITWAGVCPGGAATCKDPDITVTGAFQFSTTNIVLGGGYNPEQYSFRIIRGADAVSNEPIIARHILTGNGGEVGSCTGVWVKRGLNTLVRGASVTGVALAGNSLTLPTGAYNCRVIAPAYKNGANRIQLRRESGAAFTTVSSGIAVASINGGSAVSIIETSFRINAAVTLGVYHTCTSSPAADTDGFGDNNPNYSLGVPSQDVGSSPATYTSPEGTTFTSVSCIRAGS